MTKEDGGWRELKKEIKENRKRIESILIAIMPVLICRVLWNTQQNWSVILKNLCHKKKKKKKIWRQKKRGKKEKEKKKHKNNTKNL